MELVRQFITSTPLPPGDKPPLQSLCYGEEKIPLPLLAVESWPDQRVVWVLYGLRTV
jgi:hypothetical protein